MGKRMMVVVVGAGTGALVGVAAIFLGAGSYGPIVGAALGAVLPLLVLGKPGK
jgi:hypothetical protein